MINATSIYIIVCAFTESEKVRANLLQDKNTPKVLSLLTARKVLEEQTLEIFYG